jgi:2-keto-3-deoxy-6-phosphogluconate aldolase
LRRAVEVMLTAEQQAVIRAWILDGLSDLEIAYATMLSVKVIRLVRQEAEGEMRPR